MKRVLFIILAALLLFTTLCASTFAQESFGGNASEEGVLPMQEPPEIIVTAGSFVIPHVIGLNIWNGAIYDRQDTFTAWMDAGYEMPVLELGTEITVQFEGPMPTEMVLEDYLLNESGGEKYNSGLYDHAIPFDRLESGIRFIVNSHMHMMLSSNSNDYLPGASIRGFRLTCTWGDNSCEYAFIVRV